MKSMDFKAFRRIPDSLSIFLLYNMKVFLKNKKAYEQFFDENGRSPDISDLPIVETIFGKIVEDVKPSVSVETCRQVTYLVIGSPI